MLFKSIACLLQANSSRLSSIQCLTKNVGLNSRNVRLFHAIKNRQNLTNNRTVEVTLKPKRHVFRKFVLFGILAPTGSFLLYYQFLNEQEKRKIRVTIESFGRAVRSARIVLGIAFDYKWNLWGLDEDGEEYNKIIKECHQRSADKLVKACILNGGMYVKMGQGLSTMNQILPKEFYVTLRSLQSEALRSTGNDIDQLFKEEFDKKPLEIFKEFDYKPIAAASLAQVHKAIDKDGNEVAVKLQYLDLQDRFAGDIFTCKVLLKALAFTFPKFSFAWVLDDLREILQNELDFINEANNSKRCYKELKHLNFVYVPKVYDNLSTKRILVMEFINGLKISDIDGMKKIGLDIKDVDEKLITLFAEQIFHTGFVHADPHHGNIFVRKLKNSKAAEIVLIDHGLYDYINEKDRKNLCQLWKYIILKDDEKMKFYSTLLNVKEEYYLIFSAMIAMRPLHRPLHPTFIYNTDWVRMSEKEREKAMTEGKFRLPTPKEFAKMNREELASFRAKFKPYLEEMKENILEVFRTFPKCMLLVCRNLNTVRSIIHDHGNKVDRHTIMARIAVSGAYKEQLVLGPKQRIRAWFELKKFDFILAYDHFLRWTQRLIFKVLIFTGKLSSDILQELKKADKDHLSNYNDA